MNAFCQTHDPPRPDQCHLCWLPENHPGYWSIREGRPRSEWPGWRRTPALSPAQLAAYAKEPRRPLECVHLGKTLRRKGCCPRDSVHACTAGMGEVTQNGVCETCHLYDADRYPNAGMSVNEMVSVIESPEEERPKGWPTWAVTKEAHAEASRRFLAKLPDFPGDRDGRGIVTCGGGGYEAGLYVSIRLLREHGCTLPVQVWHRGESEPLSAAVRGLPGVTVIDAESHPRRPYWRVLGGWQLKLLAGLESGFREWLFSDADNYPVADVTPCFDHNPDGAVFWPDVRAGDGMVKWPSYGVTSDGGPGLNSGSYLIDLARSWRPAMLAHWYDMHSEFYYKGRESGCGGYGDQDQLRAAWRVCGQSFTLYARRPDHRSGAFVQAGPDGRTPLFVHRIHGKVARPGAFRVPFRRRDDLPRESRVHELFREWLRFTEAAGVPGGGGVIE